ncbi:peptide deformylase [Nodosilinea sp. LEGE 07298]|uniref:peptide deformylase n=1 Tax=Nodosilinea sp. LEGE 07298 TaxID=2777970 RepID=UPI00187E3DDB|nr:peptide deformylase [Nodosilinea sp. LEGE 07298]MBE9111685.1 peptide deformylase [Nodosilinea sp. LEGE 07298]
MTLPEPSQPRPPVAQTKVLTLGHPVLHQVAQPVALPMASVNDRSLQQLIDQLLATMKSDHGVGIAAPQLGQALRILVVASRPNLRYPHAPLMDPAVMINPRLVSASDELEMGWEGCLSVPGVRGRVPRHRVVEVEYSDRYGQPQHQVWEGFVARIFQHEADHLEGKVFLDRVTSETDLLSEAAYQTIEIADLP